MGLLWSVGRRCVVVVVEVGEGVVAGEGRGRGWVVVRGVGKVYSRYSRGGRYIAVISVGRESVP